ncbi:phage/plasmid primase, P4 family [Singulisphaera sp. Ch08]|uniref:Phage/plasmid primase, P4 family n=1 Tax=Singulisphaera sp. Ch08 TaxID=3120278 RepID=A0AAU7CLQ6_9BACT
MRAALVQVEQEGPVSEIARAVDADTGYSRSDLGNAQRFVALYGDRVRYCYEQSAWLVSNGKRWIRDRTGEVERLAKKSVVAMAHEAANMTPAERDDFLAFALSSQDRRRLDALIALARSEEGIAIETADLDRDPMLLNVLNGTVDLRTGTLRPHDPRDLITKLAPVAFDPTARRELWIKTIDRTMGNDQEVIGFLQRSIGYAATGDISEHAIFILYGKGRNGKSTFLNTILAILGDYATTIDASLLMSKAQDDHPTGLTDLEGRRFVPTAEAEDGRRFDEALVKKLTGGERIKARRMRQDFYEFMPSHKVFLAVNHKPRIKGTDEGIWSRIKLIPFNAFIPKEERIKDLDKQLAAEAPGILAWIVQGCVEWQRIGLAEPKSIEDATNSYRDEMDNIGDFLRDRCLVPEQSHLKEVAKVKASELYGAYVGWCKGTGTEPVASRAFGSEMERRGFELKKSNSQAWRLGLTLNQDVDPDPVAYEIP